MKINKESQNISLEKERNEYFVDWIYKIWHLFENNLSTIKGS